MNDFLSLTKIEAPTASDFSEMTAALNDMLTMQKKAESELQLQRMSNLQKEYKERVDFLVELGKRGVSEENQLAALRSTQALKEIDAQYAAKRKQAESLSGAQKRTALKQIAEEYKERRKKELDNLAKSDATARKLLDKQLKDKAKQDKKQAENFFKENSELQKKYGKLGAFMGPTAEEEEALRAQMKAEGKSDAEIDKAVSSAKAQAKLDAATEAIGEFAKQLEGTMNEVGQAQSEVDTRLHGLKMDGVGAWGSYWKRLEKDITKGIGVSPFLKQADMVSNLKTLVGKGIAFNIEQRAFLETISDKIATTFDAADATLLKLVRIQQADTTAGRLGMEAALNAFLNSMYQTTEYMTEAAAGIRQSLYEASALMGAEEATAFEFQVQKWLGSLYSVGFSNTSGLAESLGKLAAGDVEGITAGGTGNLLIMAATQANIPIANALEEGLSTDETNLLLEAVVKYLAQIYEETQGSKVVAQQYANVFGLSASDLKAAANLASSTGVITKEKMDYGSMLTKLNDMASTMVLRTGASAMLTNLTENFKYSIASTMGNNPMLYMTYNIASMLDDVAGGIQIPAFSVMGNMVDLDTSVADLMRVVSVGGGLLGGIGKLISSLGTGGGFSGKGMLRAFGIDNNISILTRGDGMGLKNGAPVTQTTSESGYAGNEDSSDVKQKTIDDANNEAQEDFEKVKEENEDVPIKIVDEHILLIYQLLQETIDVTNACNVKFNDQLSWSAIPGYTGGSGF